MKFLWISNESFTGAIRLLYLLADVMCLLAGACAERQIRKHYEQESEQSWSPW
jgi:hypothetical protein